MTTARLRRLVLSAVVVVTAAVLAGLPVYVRPQIDQLRHADAILVLGGAHYNRYPFAMGLAAQGWAPELVISNPLGEDDPWLSEICATPEPKYRLHCFAPDPPTTRGEGRELRRLASLHGWQSVIVVTFRPHVSRARFILEQCFDGDLIMVAQAGSLTLPRWVSEYVYQTAGYARALLEPGC